MNKIAQKFIFFSLQKCVSDERDTLLLKLFGKKKFYSIYSYEFLSF